MRRRVGLFLFCGLVLPLVVVANASAQGAVLQLDPKSGPPGTPISVTGSGFSPSTANITGGVDIRLSTRDATPLRSVVISPQNTISATFPIPSGLAPGEYLVLATQTSVRGRHLFGTPARAKLRVIAGSASATAPPPTRATSQVTVALGSAIVGLILLAGGTLAVRRLRTSNQPLGS